MSDDELLRRFEDCALLFDQWVHCAHIKVAYLYFTRQRFDVAVEKMRPAFEPTMPPTTCQMSRLAAATKR